MMTIAKIAISVSTTVIHSVLGSLSRWLLFGGENKVRFGVGFPATPLCLRLHDGYSLAAQNPSVLFLPYLLL